MNPIILAILIVAGMGLLIGLILAIASIVMSVPDDKEKEAVLEALPGINCGVCGYPGCSEYADALVKGETTLGLCAPGGSECVEEVSEILGIDAKDYEQEVAVVKCMGTYENTKDKMEYQGEKTCLSAVEIYGGSGKCSYGCIGFGDCVDSCESDAIRIKDGIADINILKCVGCKVCVATCPKDLIEMIPIKTQALVKCKSEDKGPKTRKACDVGCIGCGICVKKCNFDAIILEDNKAVIDSKKCTGCGDCVKACPQDTIVFYKVGK